MPTTLTASSWHKSPSTPHIGVAAARFYFQHSPHSPTFHPDTFGSHGDVILLCRLPAGAIMLDAMARVGVRNDDGGELRVIVAPVSTSPTRTLAVIGSLSISVLASPLKFTPANGFAPFRLSLTAGVAGYEQIGLKCVFQNSSATASISIDGWVSWMMTQDWRGGVD